jgi:hypothetical protein
MVDDSNDVAAVAMKKICCVANVTETVEEQPVGSADAEHSDVLTFDV